MIQRASTVTIKHKRQFNPKLFLAEIGDGRTIDKHRKGEAVFSQGDPSDAVYYIQKGKVKVTVVSEQGKEAVVAILGADEFFGEGCLSGQKTRASTCLTMPMSNWRRAAASHVLARIP